MDTPQTLRACLIIAVVLAAMWLEMRRRNKITRRVALAWLQANGYRVEDAGGMRVNDWTRPARVQADAVDTAGHPVRVTLTVKWLMAGVLGSGDVTCIEVVPRNLAPRIHAAAATLKDELP